MSPTRFAKYHAKRRDKNRRSLRLGHEAVFGWVTVFGCVTDNLNTKKIKLAKGTFIGPFVPNEPRNGWFGFATGETNDDRSSYKPLRWHASYRGLRPFCEDRRANSGGHRHDGVHSPYPRPKKKNQKTFLPKAHPWGPDEQGKNVCPCSDRYAGFQGTNLRRPDYHAWPAAVYDLTWPHSLGWRLRFKADLCPRSMTGRGRFVYYRRIRASLRAARKLEENFMTRCSKTREPRRKRSCIARGSPKKFGSFEVRSRLK